MSFQFNNFANKEQVSLPSSKLHKIRNKSQFKELPIVNSPCINICNEKIKISYAFGYEGSY